MYHKQLDTMHALQLTSLLLSNTLTNTFTKYIENELSQTNSIVVNCISIVGDGASRLSLMDNVEVALACTFHFHGKDACTHLLFSKNSFLQKMPT